MYERHILGKTGEELACEFLANNGYEIISQNYSCKLGEIDIIAKIENQIIFLEVKTRAQSLYGTPVEAVNVTKMKHIYRVAEYFIMKNNLEKYFVRFDVIEVYAYEDNDYCINHIKNAITERPR